MGAVIKRVTTARVVWITRPHGQGENLCRLLESTGARAIRFPVIEIVPVREKPDVQQLSRAVRQSHLVIFVSRNAVVCAGSVIPDFYKIIYGKQVLAIGAGTRAALAAKGLVDVVSPDSGIGSEALLELEQLHPEALAGGSILVVRGVGGRDKLAAALGQDGIAVEYLEVYERRRPEVAVQTLENIWHDTPPDAIILTSVEGLHNLIKMTPAAHTERLLRTRLVVMSARIESAARSLGYTAETMVSS